MAVQSEVPRRVAARQPCRPSTRAFGFATSVLGTTVLGSQSSFRPTTVWTPKQFRSRLLPSGEAFGLTDNGGQPVGDMVVLPRDGALDGVWQQGRVDEAGDACQQRYRGHIEKNATQVPAISWEECNPDANYIILRRMHPRWQLYRGGLRVPPSQISALWPRSG